MLHSKHDPNTNVSMSSVSLHYSKCLFKSSELPILSFLVKSAATSKLKSIRIVFSSIIWIVASTLSYRHAEAFRHRAHLPDGPRCAFWTGRKKGSFVVYAYIRLFRRCMIPRSTKRTVCWSANRVTHSPQCGAQSRRVSSMHSYRRRWLHSAWIPDMYSSLRVARRSATVPWP